MQTIDIKKLRGEYKVSRLKIKPETDSIILKKPNWIRVKTTSYEKVNSIKKILRQQKLFTVCEEAQCPNLAQCFGNGTATFMIMGQFCTRRCPFCDVAHGRPKPLDINEPLHLAQTVKKLALKYVVITSVTRDDLLDGGALHFVNCIKQIRKNTPSIKIEILTPDFRGKMDKVITLFKSSLPEVFNHNLETIPQFYDRVRPGAIYEYSLQLLKTFKVTYPNVITKSGLMLGLGESVTQVVTVLKDLIQNKVDMLTLGQYLQPSKHHLPVKEYITPAQFDDYKKIAYDLGFSQVASGPMVRSSYNADLQSKNVLDIITK